jgi:hypothetical protein
MSSDDGILITETSKGLFEVRHWQGECTTVIVAKPNLDLESAVRCAHVMIQNGFIEYGIRFHFLTDDCEETPGPDWH